MLTHADIQAAARRLQGAVLQTPCVESRTLSQITGAQVYLKFENLQFTASFKERGALNKLLLLSDAERTRGVIAMSAGNHAQGVAYHAQRLGLRAVIVMPRFEDPQDAPAQALLQSLFPSRRILTVPGREILLGGGNIHCITQQEPLGRRSFQIAGAA